MEMEEPWSGGGIPLDATVPFTQGEKQHLIWGFSEFDWGPPTPPPAAGTAVPRNNMDGFWIVSSLMAVAMWLRQLFS